LLGARVIVSSSREPLCAAARVLASEGIDPDIVLAMRHVGRADDALRARLATAAALTVEESAHGPVFRSYRAPPSAVDRPPVAQTAPAGIGHRAALAARHGRAAP
jgi:hypothetical protein